MTSIKISNFVPPIIMAQKDISIPNITIVYLKINVIWARHNLLQYGTVLCTGHHCWCHHRVYKTAFIWITSPFLIQAIINILLPCISGTRCPTFTLHKVSFPLFKLHVIFEVLTAASFTAFWDAKPCSITFKKTTKLIKMVKHKFMLQSHKEINNSEMYWVFGIWPSSSIPKTIKHISELAEVSSF